MGTNYSMDRETFYLAIKLYESHKACDIALSSEKITNEFEFDVEALKDGKRYIKLLFIDQDNVQIKKAYSALHCLDLIIPDIKMKGYYMFVSCYFDFNMGNYIKGKYKCQDKAKEYEGPKIRS